MRFKDFFLLTEDPDDLFMGDKSALTFGFCGNFIMYFYDNHAATHWELLCIAKKNIFKLEYGDMVNSKTTEDDLKWSEPYYRQIGIAPENVINFLKNKGVADIRRGTFLDAVDDGFLGRISMQHDIVSFWNSADSFSSEDKKTVERIVKLYGKDPTKMKYNFYNGKDTEDNDLNYSQFFKLAPTQTPIKAADTSHIVHELPPEKKKEALIQMGVKPKAAKGVEARYAMGESFKDFFKESPDHSVTMFPLEEPVDGMVDETLGWRMSDARTFIVHDDFICLTNSNSVFHCGLFEYIDDVFTHGNKHLKSLLTFYGTPSVKLLSYMGPDSDREFVLRKLPKCIQGRIWTEHNYISFWNNSRYVKNNLSKVVEMIKLIGGNPNEYQWEVDDTDPVSLASLENKSQSNDLVNKKSTNTSDWQKVVHELPPEKKKDALQQMGVKPKAAKGVEARYAMGESFKDFFKENAEAIKTDEVNYVSYGDRDASAFLVNKDFNILAQHSDLYHYELVRYAYKFIDNERIEDANIHGIPSEDFKTFLNGPDNCDSRASCLRHSPDTILGRLWTTSKYVGFWNTIGYLKSEFPHILKMFKDNNLNPEEFKWEIPDISELMSFDDFQKELNILPDSIPQGKPEVADWQKKIHLAPAEIKGELLKQQGVKPKPAMGVQQRYLNGESFRFKDFFKVLTENDSTTTPNKLPDPDLSGLTETLKPKVSDNLVAQALTIANVPFISIDKLKGTNIAFLATDAHIQSRLLVSMGMGPLIKKAKIPTEKLYLYDTANATWVKPSTDHIVGWHNTSYAITSSVWRSIFGDYAFTQLGKTAVVVEPEQITPVAAPQTKTLSSSKQEELIAFAIRRALRPFIGSSNYMKNIAANGLTKNLKVIYLGIENDLVKKAKIPADKLFYFVNGDWTDETPEEDYEEYVGMLGIDWANTFGQDAMIDLKKQVKSYVGGDEEKEETETTTEGLSSKLTKNFAISRAIHPFTNPSAVPGIESNDNSKYLWIIYVGKTNDLIEAANIDKTKLAYFVNNEWVTEEAPFGTPKGIEREEWVKVFGKKSLDTLMDKIKTLIPNSDIKENVNMFTESPDRIKDRNDPENHIYYNNNKESYTVLMLTDGTPGNFVFRKDSSPQTAGHGNLRSILSRIKNHELRPSDDINALKSDIPLDEIAKKQHDRGSYDVRVWTHNKIISYWTEWRSNFVKPTMALLKFLGQNPEEYMYEMDGSYYDSSKADSPGCYTYEEFTTGHKDHSPEALKLKQQRFEDRKKLAQAKLGMLNKDQALRQTDVPIKGLGKAPSFYKNNSGD